MPLPLTMAISNYIHTRDLADGRVRAEGIDLNVLTYPFEQVGLRFAMAREFDISEYSFGGYCAHVAHQERPEMIAIPVFPSRVFRQSGIYIGRRAGIEVPKDLHGKRVGVPQWSQTAAIFIRGYLAHQAGVDLGSISWIQAGVNQPGRKEGVPLSLPGDIRLEVDTDHSLSDMLAEGRIDAALSARAPDSFLTGHPNVARLFPDYQAVERAYFRETGIFPIMHVVVIRRDIYEQNRWIARNLLQAFNTAKTKAFAELADGTTSFLPAPWSSELVRENIAFVSDDDVVWPYGLQPNRATIEPFLSYCFEQGVTSRQLSLDELFAPECAFEVLV